MYSIGELFFLLDLELFQHRLFQLERSVCVGRCSTDFRELKEDIEQNTGQQLGHVPSHHRFFTEQFWVFPFKVQNNNSILTTWDQIIMYANLASDSNSKKSERETSFIPLIQKINDMLSKGKLQEYESKETSFLTLYRDYVSEKNQATKVKFLETFAEIRGKWHEIILADPFFTSKKYESYLFEPILGNLLLLPDNQTFSTCAGKPQKSLLGGFFTYLFGSGSGQQDRWSYSPITNQFPNFERLINSDLSPVKYSILFQEQSLSNLIDHQKPATLFLVKRNTFQYKESIGMEPSALREAALLRRLHHPHLLPLIDVLTQPRLSGIDVNDVNLIFPFFPNTLLSWRLSRDKLSVRQFVRIARQLLEVVHYLHESTHGTKEAVIHRNIHPGNIWVNLKPKNRLTPYISPLQQYVLDQKINLRAKESVDELTAWIAHEIYQDKVEDIRFSQDYDTEVVDIFVGGMHLSGFAYESISMWNANYFPLVQVTKQGLGEVTEENPLPLKVLMKDEKEETLFKSRLTLEQAKLGDLFAVGCLLVFLIRGTTNLFVKDDEKEECTLSSLFSKRIEFIKSWEGESKVLDGYFTSKTALDIHGFVKILLECGNYQSTLGRRVISAKKLLSHEIFQLEPTTRKQVKLPLGIQIQPIADVLNLLDELERKNLQRIVTVQQSVARIPKLKRQIGPLEKKLDEYTDEEWRDIEQKWEKKKSDSFQFLFSCYNITQEFERTKKNIVGRPFNVKYCLCVAMGLFNMVDKSFIQENENDTLSISPLLQFSLACWVGACKLVEYFWNSSDYQEWKSTFYTKWIKEEKKDLPLLSQMISVEETKLFTSLNFYSWSPIHIAIFCEQQRNWLFGYIGDGTMLVKLMVSYLKNSGIKLILLDLNLFTDSHFDINDFVPKQDTDDITFTFHKITFELLDALYDAKIQIYFVSRFDPTNVVANTKTELSETEKKQSKYALARLVSSVKDVAVTTGRVLYREYLRQDTEISPSFPVSANLTVENVRDFLKRKLEKSLNEQYYKYKGIENDQDKKNLPENKWTVTDLSVSKKFVEAKEVFLIAFDTKQYVKIRKFANVYGNIALKLWDMFHSTLIDEQKKEKKEEVEDLTEKYFYTEEDKKWIVKSDALPTYYLNLISTGDYTKLKPIINSGLNQYLSPILFPLIHLETPSVSNSYATDFLFQHADSLSPFNDNFLLHIGFALMDYNMRNNTSLTTDSLLLVTGDLKSLYIAAQKCMNALSVSSLFNREHLQNYVLQKTLQSLSFCVKTK